MRQQEDLLWPAIARWVFGYIRWQLRCGQTLHEIEQNLLNAVENGELYYFVKSFNDLKEDLRKQTIEANANARL